MKTDLELKVNIKLQAVNNITKEIVDEREIHNIVVTTGKSRIANLINGGSSNAFDYIAIGTGTTSPVVGDTALETEVARALATVGESPSGTATWSNTFTFTSGESYAITELGVFDNAVESGSTMMNRSTFTAVNVDVDIDLIANVTLTVDNCP